MEAYSSYYSSSNSSHWTQNREESKGVKQVYPLESHNSWLHSVRKSPSKPWKKAPTPIKVYKVDAINFREVVQQLTGAPEHKPQQLVPSNAIARAGTAIDYGPKQSQSRGGDTCGKRFHDLEFGMNSPGTNDGEMAPAFLGTNLLSPTSYDNFCFFPPITPTGVTSLEPGKVL